MELKNKNSIIGVRMVDYGFFELTTYESEWKDTTKQKFKGIESLLKEIRLHIELNNNLIP